MVRFLKRVVIAVGVGIVSLMSAPASAFAVAQDSLLASAEAFSRDRNTSVQERPRPEYEARGLRGPGVVFFPRIEVATDTTNNLYASANGPVRDVAVRMGPELSVESDAPNHAWTAYVRGRMQRYADNRDENTDAFSAGAVARIDLTRQMHLSLGADRARGFEPRSATTAAPEAVKPTKVSETKVYAVGARASGRVKLSGRADWRVVDYDDNETRGGVLIDQDARDRRIASVSGRVDWAVSPDTAVFVQATGNRRAYARSAGPMSDRRSKGAEILAGASFDIAATVRGEIAAGYVEQDFEATAYDDVSGLGARGRIEWFPSGLTTVEFAAGRTVEDTPELGASAFVADTASIGVDHELLRNVILDAHLTWTRDAYAGIDREDTRLDAKVGVTYLVQRNLGLNASAQRLDVRSAGAARDRDFNIASLAFSVVVQV